LLSQTDNNYRTYFDATAKTREAAKASLKELVYTLKIHRFFVSVEKKNMIPQGDGRGAKR
jgi:hypothetical protein